MSNKAASYFKIVKIEFPLPVSCYNYDLDRDDVTRNMEVGVIEFYIS